jgi:hypothetical protein
MSDFMMSLVWLKERKPRHDAALPSCHRRKGRATREVVRIGTEDREWPQASSTRRPVCVGKPVSVRSSSVVTPTSPRPSTSTNLIAQLKSGVYALATPVDNLVSNWAYMVMASLAWSLKAWAALLVPETPRHAEAHRAEKQTLLRMEFRTFCAAMIEMPCQIVRGSRRLVYRLLSWNPWQGVFLRLVERLNSAWLC